MDSDNTHTPGLIAGMVEGIREGNDVMIASRFRPGARIMGVPLYRRALSILASWTFRLTFPTPNVRDFTSGYRAYRAGLLRKAFETYGDDFVAQSGFSCMVDILLKLRKLGAIMSERPLVLRYDFKYGVSKMHVLRTILGHARAAGAPAPRRRVMRARDAERVGDYFARPGTVAEWWRPDEGPLAFHYAAELRVLEDVLPVDPALAGARRRHRAGTLRAVVRGARLPRDRRGPQRRDARARARAGARRGTERALRGASGPRGGSLRVRAGALRPRALHGALRPPAGPARRAARDAPRAPRRTAASPSPTCRASRSTGCSATSTAARARWSRRAS